MRTSTVVFLVVFLCFFSSREHRSKFHSLVDGLRSGLHEVTSDRACSFAFDGCRDGKRADAAEPAELRNLRADLRGMDEREEAADKILRTIDRSVRALTDRIRKLEHDAKRHPDQGDVYERSLTLLIRQQGELEAERGEILELKGQLEGEKVRLRAEMDLARIRGERREVESFLRNERVSPVEALAGAVR